MQWLQRVWIQITADRKRFGILCAMGLIGLLLWARIIIIAKPPRTAVADDEQSLPEMSANTTPEVSDNRSDHPVQVSLWDQPSRDPFLIRDEYYPKPTPIASSNTDQGKSGPKHAEDPETAEARLVARLQRGMDNLSLQAVLKGSPTMAVINGKMYRPGSLITSPGDEEVQFRLEAVNERSVVLEFEGRRFTLVMPYPGEA